MTDHPTDRPVVWSIAGSDSGAGAGIQADLKAASAFGVHLCTAIAAITAQHSTAVTRIDPVAPDLLDAQLAALAADLPPRVIKTGMLGNAENVRVVARWVRRLREAGPVALVVDPVLRASSGAPLGDDSLRRALLEELLPLATLATPNRTEAAALLGLDALPDDASVARASQALRATGCRAVAITGGDHPDVPGAPGANTSRDHVLTPQADGWLSLPRVATRHNHGTGCTFATSAAAALALGWAEIDALVLAKMATTHALQRGYAAGHGPGPVCAGPGFGDDINQLPAMDLPGGAIAPGAGFAPLADPALGLYVIVDSAAWVQRVLDAGVRTVQLRIKDRAHPGLREEIAASIAAARAAGAQLFINDHWQLAIELGAYGVHLGQEDLETADLPAIQRAGLRLGLSTHAYWEVCRAWALRPSYIACGPIHATDSKDMPWIPQGNANLTYWCHLLPLPVVGIAGMDEARVAEARRCGAASAALISAVTRSPDVHAAVQQLQQAWARGASPEQAPPFAPPALPKATLQGAWMRKPA